jgi:hypothetical protein
MSDAPPIDVTKPRHDLTTFSGRLQHFVEVTSPLTLLASKRELKEAQQLLDDYRAGKRKDLYDRPEAVYKAKQRASALRVLGLIRTFAVVDSSVHPDTGEPVPLPFRMSGPSHLYTSRLWPSSSLQLSSLPTSSSSPSC